MLLLKTLTNTLNINKSTSVGNKRSFLEDEKAFQEVRCKSLTKKSCFASKVEDKICPMRAIATNGNVAAMPFKFYFIFSLIRTLGRMKPVM